MTEDPFATLGLPPRADVTDDDVRVAWRRIAAATHPDRDDGGDPARFGAAAAAYALLRSAYGRGEALADVDSGGARGGRRARRGIGARGAGALGGIMPGRPGLLALRVVAASAVSAFAYVFAGWAPATFGVLAGALTWLIAVARHDLPPRR